MEKEKNSAERDVFNGEYNDDDDDDEQEQEKKMDKFFALIRSFRDARNQLAEIDELKKKKKKKKRKTDHDDDDEQQSGWVPSFKWEDFAEEIQFRKLPLIFPAPCNKKQDDDDDDDEDKKLEEDNKDGGLDLKLAL